MLQRINRWTFGDARRGHRRGFTLIELMAVMAIVMVLSGLVVAGYFGIVRGSARASASQHLFNNLMLTRQRAMMNGAHTFLIVLPSEEGATTLTRYAIVQSAGRITNTADNQFLLDRYADLQNLFAGDSSERLRFIYNVSGLLEGRNVSGTDYGQPFALIQVLPPDPDVPEQDPEFRESYYLQLRYLIPNLNSVWRKHDRYGWQVGPVQHLPRGFMFDANVVNNHPFVAFNPTGDISNSDDVEFKLIEEINPDRPIEIEVSRVGSIRVVRE